MAAPLTRETILQTLSAVAAPGGSDVVAAGMIQGVVVRDGKVGFMIEVAPEDGARMEPLRRACEDAVRALPGVLEVTAVLTAHGGGARPQPREVRIQDGKVGPRPAGAALNRNLSAQAQPVVGTQRQAIPGIASIIAVASGKGGVGKSTVAVNLAIALSRLGKRVGLLDADIYGPSVPHLLHIVERPESLDGKKLDVIRRFGIETMSIGFLVDIDTPMIWRGPMVMSALTQMLNDVNWGQLDVLVVDMPPGTGDAQLTMAQRVPLAGAVIVSTPQDIALIDARKGLAMFRKTEVPVLGIVENMSTYICPNCGHEAHIFGHGGARETAAKLGCDFLGEIPLDIAIRETSDAGTPIVASAPDGPQARAFIAVAALVAAKLDHGGIAKPPPRIVIQ